MWRSSFRFSSTGCNFVRNTRPKLPSTMDAMKDSNFESTFTALTPLCLAFRFVVQHHASLLDIRGNLRLQGFYACKASLSAQARNKLYFKRFPIKITLYI